MRWQRCFCLLRCSFAQTVVWQWNAGASAARCVGWRGSILMVRILLYKHSCAPMALHDGSSTQHLLPQDLVRALVVYTN